MLAMTSHCASLRSGRYGCSFGPPKILARRTTGAYGVQIDFATAADLPNSSVRLALCWDTCFNSSEVAWKGAIIRAPTKVAVNSALALHGVKLWGDASPLAGITTGKSLNV